MPILDVEVVCAAGDAASLPPASVIAAAAGKALGSRPGSAWVRLRVLDARCYGENEAEPPAPGPVFVTVTHARPPTGDVLDAEVGVLTQAVASVLGRPAENVHVEYAPAAAGRIAFGGRLVR